jgi:hypothetical protein
MTPQEHADDLEPQVNDGGEVETEDFPDDDDLGEHEAGDDANPMSRVDEGSAPPPEEDEEQRKDDASDSI